MSDYCYWDECKKLTDVVGKKVVDVVGRVSTEFGGLTFKILAVKFDDGSYEPCGGEHDFPYVEVVVPERFHPKEDES
jgi:hypothetical protein